MKFFVIRKPEPDTTEDRLARTDAIKDSDFTVGESIRCPNCNRPLSLLEWLPPHRIELETWGRRYGDVADIADDLIVSERFIEVYTESRLRGLVNFKPVEIVKLLHRREMPAEPLPRYFKATVVRSSTIIDQEASGYIWEDPSKVCPCCLFDTLKRFRHLVVKESSWDGSDVFFPRGGYGPLVSDRFRCAFIGRGLLGAVFVPSEEYCYDFFPWEREDCNSEDESF